MGVYVTDGTVQMDGTTDTKITIRERKPGYAHVSYSGTYEGEKPTADELAAFLEWDSAKNVAHFGYRGFWADNGAFHVIVHID